MNSGNFLRLNAKFILKEKLVSADSMDIHGISGNRV